MITRVRVSTVVIHNEQILTFLAIDPTSGKEYYFLPGGEIGPDETAPEAGERETLEETGYQVRVEVSKNVDKEYIFHWNGQDYMSLTVFYRAHLINPFQSPKRVEDAPYNKGVHWLPLGRVKDVFSYNEEILQAVEELSQ